MGLFTNHGAYNSSLYNLPADKDNHDTSMFLPSDIKIKRPNFVMPNLSRLKCLCIIILLMTIYTKTVSCLELVMFETQGCMWCILWNNEIGQIYYKTQEGKRAPLRRMDISNARSSELSFTGPVTHTPTFILVSGGREIGRITGYPGPDFFWPLLMDLIKIADGMGD